MNVLHMMVSNSRIMWDFGIFMLQDLGTIVCSFSLCTVQLTASYRQTYRQIIVSLYKDGH